LEHGYDLEDGFGGREKEEGTRFAEEKGTRFAEARAHDLQRRRAHIFFAPEEGTRPEEMV
jgi:hypothetical protein